MLIIFDLDDTLIDTSGYVTPFKLQQVLTEMLGLKPTEEQLRALVEANEKLARSKDAVMYVGQQFGLSAASIAKGLEQLTSPLPSDFKVPCTPGAKEILEEFKLRGRLALVTVGHAPFQLDKLEKAGIEASIFSKIAIPGDSAKKAFYEALAEEFSESPSDVWVCGDRISVDLLPAYELNFRTIHMRWGRGENVIPEPWIDFSISKLTELRNIIR